MQLSWWRVVAVLGLCSVAGIANGQQLQQPVSNTLGIWAAPMQPGWPTVIAAVLPASWKLSPNAVFDWRFPTDKNSTSTCTMFGQRNLTPCRGSKSVVDHTYSTIGVHQIDLTITDSTLPQPAKVSAQVTIKSIRDFKPVFRPEIRQLDMVGMNRTIWGLYRLLQLGVYTHMARIHYQTFSENVYDGSNRNAAHMGPSFLPWHRSSMRIVEVCMQVALNYSDYALPYFDWQQGYTGMESYMGPFGDPVTGIVKSGPFCNDPAQVASASCPKMWVLPPDFPDPVKAIRRKANTTPFHFQTPAEYNALMNTTQYDEYPFSDVPTMNSFRNALEGWAMGSYGYTHNGFHRWVGGTMGDVTIAFYDPLFLVHHVQVDRLFTVWQKLHGCADGRGSAVCYRPGDMDPAVNATTPGVISRDMPDGSSVYVLDGSMYNDPMYPWNIRASEVLQAEVGYTYLAPNVKPPQIPDPIKNPPNIFGDTKPAQPMSAATSLQVHLYSAVVLLVSTVLLM